MIKAKYEDTFADIGTANDLGYLEMIAANPGVDPGCLAQAPKSSCPRGYILPPGPREGIVINLAEYRLYYYPKARCGAHLPAGDRSRRLGLTDR